MSESISPSIPLEAPAGPLPVFAEVYAEHAAFMWRSLRRLGVRPADVEDASQEAFLVVHKRLRDFRGGSMRAWLFAIALRIAADQRRRAFIKREVASDVLPETAVPEEQTGAVDRARAAALLESILETLDEDRRAVFILYELEQMPMSEVAAALGCPLQTAYSRLRVARERVLEAVERWKRQKRERT